jgi:osmotically-inducible protein OsmY
MPVADLRRALEIFPSRCAVLVVAICLLSPACASRGPVGEDQAAIDEWISAEVRRLLEEEQKVVVADLRIETRDGILVLSGVQPSLEAVAIALDRASRVRGVLQVVNRIRVVEG